MLRLAPSIDPPLRRAAGIALALTLATIATATTAGDDDDEEGSTVRRARSTVATTTDPTKAGTAARSPRPPVAKKVPQVTEVHGERLVDDYFWLRRRDDPEVIAYLEAENAYTEAMTAHTKALRETLYREMVSRIVETDLSVPVPHGGWAYYERTEAGKEYKIYCRKRLVDGEAAGAEQVLLDLNAIAADGGHDYLRLGIYEPSPDHRLLAYALDTDGSEVYRLRFLDLETGELLDDRLDEVAYAFAWANDNRTVFYTARDHAQRPHKVLRHVLGSEQASDAEVFHDPDERFWVWVGTTRSRKFVVAASGSSTSSEVHLLAADAPGGDFEVFRPRQPEVEYDVDHHGEHLYVRTNEDGAKNFKLMRVPLAEDPGASERWQEVIAHRPETKLEGVELFAGHMVVLERTAGLRRLSIRDLAANGDDGGDGDAGDVVVGPPRPVPMPESVYSVSAGENPDFAATVYRYEYDSPVTPESIFAVDLTTGEPTLLDQKEVPGGFDSTAYETRRLYARARDGMAVPITLLHKKGLARDGKSPCLLYGYGSYGVTIDPSFSRNKLSLVDRGFVYAIAHVRGGGTLGEPWHDAGKMLVKRNTFTDFIDAAELLIEQRYTAPEKLVIEGGSAGGLLVGAVINMRPDLFRAALARVPFVDVINTMLDESIPLTVGEFEEWGNPRDEAYFRYMRSYSPYDNVAAQDYPALLITAGLHDPRVQYWEPAKWTAKLRALKTDRNPLLLKTDMGAGHRGASGRYAKLEELAFLYAFVLDSLGLAG